MITSMWHVLALVLSISFAFLSVFLILLLLQIRDTVKTVEKIAKDIEKEVLPIVVNVEGITSNVEGISDKANDFVGDVQLKTSNNLDSLKNLLKHISFVIMNYFMKALKALKINIETLADENDEIIAEEEIKTSKKTTNSKIIDHINK